MDARWQDSLLAKAQRQLPSHVHEYFAGGAREGVSLAEAQGAWRRLRFQPHILRDVSSVSLEVEVLGDTYAAPIAIAPTSLQRLAHPDGELAMARAAAAEDTLLVIPSNAGTRFEEIADTGVAWWLQLYVPADRSLVEGLLERAVGAGARAVVVTVDAPGVGTKYSAADAAFGDLSAIHRVNHDDAVGAGPPGHARDLGPADLRRVGELTGLPVVAKGVLRADDARRCVQAGCAAVWVSNHGGRQLDRSTTTADALEPIVASLGPGSQTYVDGGITSGLDVLAATASGAATTFLGRLPLLALAAGGEAAVVDSLQRLKSETEEAFRLAGCARVAETSGLLEPRGPTRHN